MCLLNPKCRSGRSCAHVPRCAPVTKEASSLRRKSTGRAISGLGGRGTRRENAPGTGLFCVQGCPQLARGLAGCARQDVLESWRRRQAAPAARVTRRELWHRPVGTTIYGTPF